ncbi:MAG: excinuclease ABC subunit UvrA [Bacteriovoracaceae bacterium]|nr:excinuclease ABC subunit UvrA [Bacteriovoracaceae bacterium]
MYSEIIVTKAKVHNLKSISVSIPKNAFTVITGPSGSGKSSLAFDTIYVEGQRRYIESLSAYARQFLGQYQPPDVESIEGLSPAIAIDQKTTSKNPRSTVGTITEVYNYLRVLFARIGTLYCPETNDEIRKYTPTQIVNKILDSKERTKIHILAPLNTNGLESEVSKYLAMGFSRCRVNKKLLLLEEVLQIEQNIESLEIVVDRIAIKVGIKSRLTDSVELALKIGEGILKILIDDEEVTLSQKNLSPKINIVYPDLTPALFSFNSPIGACKECNGLGVSKVFDLQKMLLDPNFSILNGAIKPLSKKNTFLYKMILNVAEHEKVDLHAPYNNLPKEFIDIILNGTEKIYKYSFQSENSQFDFKKAFEGLFSWLQKKYLSTTSEKVRIELEQFMTIKTCPSCNGDRLSPVALSTKINDKNIMALNNMPISKLYSYFKDLKLEGEKKVIANKLLKEIKNRLTFLNNVGLGYLSLGRSAATLSGGEGQRIRLATQIGSALTGVLYVLDEPSIGLHQKDNHKLLDALHSLKDIGNTVLVVEHDEDAIKSADYIVDMGPGAGIHGGKIIATGTLEQVKKCKKSITASYLLQDDYIPIPKTRRKLTRFLKLNGATQNNISNLDVKIPLDGLVCITGISGSGKSTLLHEILTPAIKVYLSHSQNSIHQRNNYNSISGVNNIKTVIELDQAPIGKTPQSNPATYTGVLDNIRTLFSNTQESKVRGYKPGRFSFNVKGGRCEECEGNGVKKIEMHFLPDVYVTCSECNGTRYNRETLSILYKGKNISDVLHLTIEEACSFFKNHQRIFKTLSTLNSIGLGYMELGQPATTLSGGEAQRLKLAKELAKRTKGHSLYILDEPTTGLHFKDIQILLNAINDLVDKGNSVLIIEHNLDVIKNADYIIDLGPEGGDKGGEIVATGVPEEIIKNKKSHTAFYLKSILGRQHD